MYEALTFVGEQAFLAPDDLCRFGASSRESFTFTLSDKLWQALRNRIQIRKLPTGNCITCRLDDSIAGHSNTQIAPGIAGHFNAQIAPAKYDFLRLYIPAFMLRKRVCTLWNRVRAFWIRWVPEATNSFRAGLTDAELTCVEKEFGIELPEDYAESLRCHDGQNEGSWWFAGTALQQPAVRVLRLLPLHEALETRSMRSGGVGHDELPLAVALQRDPPIIGQTQDPLGTMICQIPWLCITQDETVSNAGVVPQYGEVWQYEVDERTNIVRNSRRHASSFLEYLSVYVDFLESVPAQFVAQGGCETQEVLGPVLRHLFAMPSIECTNHDGQWATTGFGMGKGNSWCWSGKHDRVTIAFPRWLVRACGSKRRSHGKK